MLVDIKEHDPEDLAKGWLRLGRETKSEPVDITDRLEDIEFVPMWVQTGERPEIISEDHAWLWDNGHQTKYGLDVHRRWKDVWYVCLDGKQLANIEEKKDGLWAASYQYFHSFHFQYKSFEKDEVLHACLQIHSEGHEYR